MQDIVFKKIKEINKTNYFIWFSVLGGMIIIFLIAIFIHFFSENNISVGHLKSDNIILFIIALLAFTIFYFKKRYLNIKAILEKSVQTNIKFLNSPLADLKDLFPNGEILAKAIVILKRNLMILWFLADLIIIIAFIGFLINGSLQSLIIYSIVALYSILLNYPSIGYIEKFYYKLSEE